MTQVSIQTHIRLFNIKTNQRFLINPLQHLEAVKLDLKID